MLNGEPLGDLTQYSPDAPIDPEIVCTGETLPQTDPYAAEAFQQALQEYFPEDQKQNNEEQEGDENPPTKEYPISQLLNTPLDKLAETNTEQDSAVDDADNFTPLTSPKLQDLQVTVHARFLTVKDKFFERVGIDFDFNIDDRFPGNQVTVPDGGTVLLGGLMDNSQSPILEELPIINRLFRKFDVKTDGQQNDQQSQFKKTNDPTDDDFFDRIGVDFKLKFNDQDKSENDDPTPALSQIPYLNRLFKNLGTPRSHAELMILVTPHITIQEE